ncbi:hypothetical protein LAZ67_X001728 [Cordylochernes scorpioides]|uniref:Uncharacterized protein n=1 Tax=Cordylochernes scorpioides TaxID=51811 RepID=A0ABY6LUT6_9ARAC|nr:hypothetical protein LAZ67_X001728 [Cordylochernes scorpioides]
MLTEFVKGNDKLNGQPFVQFAKSTTYHEGIQQLEESVDTFEEKLSIRHTENSISKVDIEEEL